MLKTPDLKKIFADVGAKLSRYNAWRQSPDVQKKDKIIAASVGGSAALGVLTYGGFYIAPKVAEIYSDVADFVSNNPWPVGAAAITAAATGGVMAKSSQGTLKSTLGAIALGATVLGVGVLLELANEHRGITAAMFATGLGVGIAQGRKKGWPQGILAGTASAAAIPLAILGWDYLAASGPDIFSSIKENGTELISHPVSYSLDRLRDWPTLPSDQALGPFVDGAIGTGLFIAVNAVRNFSSIGEHFAKPLNSRQGKALTAFALSTFAGVLMEGPNNPGTKIVDEYRNYQPQPHAAVIENDQLKRLPDLSSGEPYKVVLPKSSLT